MRGRHRLLPRLAILLIVVGLLAAALPSPAAAATWRYAALGDSLGTGIFAFRGYVPRYRDHIVRDTRNSVTLTNHSRNGWTSTDLLAALRAGSFRTSLEQAHVITWDIGGNDLRAARDSYKAGTCHEGTDNPQHCLDVTVATFETNWSAIIDEILAQCACSPVTTPGKRSAIIRTMDIYNPYVNRDKAADTIPGDEFSDFQVFKPYISEINAYIASTATGRGIPYARVYAAFNADASGNHLGEIDPSSKGYITFDGLHPNDTGHSRIAAELRSLKYAPLK